MADGESDLHTDTDDLRSTLANAMAESGVEVERPAPAERAPAAEKLPVERARDETGKFAPKPAETQAAPAPRPDPTQKPVETAAPAATRRAPVSWDKETQPLFDTLPPAIQEQILKREAEAQRGFSQRDERVKFADDFQRAIAPHREMIARSGYTNPIENVQVLMNAQAALQANPRQALFDIGRTFGFDLSPLLQQQQQRQPQAPHPLEVEVRQLKSYLQDQARSEQQKQIDAQQAAIDAFAQAHPHFATVESTIEALIRTGQSKTLDDAYDKAVWMDPTVRAQLIASQTAPAAQQTRTPDQAAVRRAQAAGASVRGAPSGTVASAPKDSLRDEIAAAMNA